MMNWMDTRTVIGTLVLLAAGAGAGAGAIGAAEPETPYRAPGTVRMAEELQRWEREQGRNNPYGNLEALESLQGRVASIADPGQRAQLRFQLAEQLLNAGRPEDCLTVLSNVLDVMFSRDVRFGPSSRMLVRQLHGIALLRLGEMENCLHHHNPDSCLFPIRREGRHVLERGSSQAEDVFAQLARRPSDYGSRWLLNIAAMTLGKYPEAVPERLRIPESVFASEYPLARFRDVAMSAGLRFDALAGASVAEDFDGDGWLDVFLTSWSIRDDCRYFKNLGNGRFEDRSAAAGLTGLSSGLNAMQTDYNNDGWPDLYIVRGAWLGSLGNQPNSLLRNNGDGTFADVTEEAGLLAYDPGLSAAWFDANNDGWLDLFVGNETVPPDRARPCHLFLNDGRGRFKDVAREAGVALTQFVRGVTAGDFDNDGWSDLYISVLGGKNLLLRNGGDAARVHFTDVAGGAGVTEPELSFPAWFWDYNNDGWLDIFVSGYGADLDAFSPGNSGHNTLNEMVLDRLGLPSKAEKPRLFRNDGRGRFTDLTQEANLHHALLSMGASFGDLDNDGFLDFYVGTGTPYYGCLLPNEMFRNDAGRAFQNVSTSGGFGHLQKGHGIAFADLNNDGQQDVLSNMGGAYTGDNYFDALFANPGHSNHWVSLKLVGRKTNRAAYGARIKLVVTERGRRREIHRAVGSTSSFGSTPLRQEIGLGQAGRIDRLEVWWPASGQTNAMENVAADRFYEIAEGESEPQTLAREKFAWPMEHAAHAH